MTASFKAVVRIRVSHFPDACWIAVVILSFGVSQGCDLRRPVVDSVADGTRAA
jgi:hypothetical protein